MAFEVTRLWLHPTTYPREDKYESRYLVKERPSKYKRGNKNVQLLKEELWTKRTTAEVMMLRRIATTDDLEIIKEIKRNNTKEWEVVQTLEKNNGLS